MGCAAASTKCSRRVSPGTALDGPQLGGRRTVKHESAAVSRPWRVLRLGLGCWRGGRHLTLLCRHVGDCRGLCSVTRLFERGGWNVGRRGAPSGPKACPFVRAPSGVRPVPRVRGAGVLDPCTAGGGRQGSVIAVPAALSRLVAVARVGDDGAPAAAAMAVAGPGAAWRTVTVGPGVLTVLVLATVGEGSGLEPHGWYGEPLRPGSQGGVWCCSSAGAVRTHRVSSILRLGFGEYGFGRLDGGAGLVTRCRLRVRGRVRRGRQPSLAR